VVVHCSVGMSGPTASGGHQLRLERGAPSVNQVDQETVGILEVTGWKGAPSDDLLPLLPMQTWVPAAGVTARWPPSELTYDDTPDALQRMLGILEAIADPVLVADAAGTIVHVNRQAEIVFGYELGELTRQPIEPVLGGQRKDGSRIAVETRFGSFEVDGDRFTSCVIRDVSSHRHLERLKDEFFTNVSHELRTPIATIRTLTDVLLAQSAAGGADGVDRLLGNIQREAERMENLVEELLELGRLKAGAVQLRLARCDVRELMERAAKAIEPLARKRLQVVEVVVPDRPVIAVVDSARLEQALLNLLSNAHKYSFEASLIWLKLERAQTQLVITVADDGPGIHEEDRERVFQRFYRSPKAAVRRVQGSGLGLAIARSVVELHRGYISIESPPECGAVFRIHLPLGKNRRRATMRAAHDRPACR
jgi:signal transduction histidine kinase